MMKWKFDFWRAPEEAFNNFLLSSLKAFYFEIIYLEIKF